MRTALRGGSIFAFATCVAGCSNAPGNVPSAADASAGAQEGDSGDTTDAGPTTNVSSGSDSGTDAATADPCHTPPIPTTLYGRKVVYRTWGADAKGDGTYFATQAPSRLGFNRRHGLVWIVQFQVENDTYLGRISAYGDSVGGLAWISDSPTDPTFAITNQTMAYGGHGGGDMSFVVARNDTDALALKADPKYSGTPQLRGGQCYYVAFENADYPETTITTSFFTSAVDGCGSGADPTCYYLAFDFDHRLHALDGTTVAGAVMPGYTIGP
jgi:hypothetical protein